MNKIFSCKKTQMKVACIKIHKHSAHPNKIKIINQILGYEKEMEEQNLNTLINKIILNL